MGLTNRRWSFPIRTLDSRERERICIYWEKYR